MLRTTQRWLRSTIDATFGTFWPPAKVRGCMNISRLAFLGEDPTSGIRVHLTRDRSAVWEIRAFRGPVKKHSSKIEGLRHMSGDLISSEPVPFSSLRNVVRCCMLACHNVDYRGLLCIVIMMFNYTVISVVLLWLLHRPHSRSLQIDTR